MGGQTDIYIARKVPEAHQKCLNLSFHLFLGSADSLAVGFRKLHEVRVKKLDTLLSAFRRWNGQETFRSIRTFQTEPKRIGWEESCNLSTERMGVFNYQCALAANWELGHSQVSVCIELFAVH